MKKKIKTRIAQKTEEGLIDDVKSLSAHSEFTGDDLLDVGSASSIDSNEEGSGLLNLDPSATETVIPKNGVKPAFKSHTETEKQTQSKSQSQTQSPSTGSTPTERATSPDEKTIAIGSEKVSSAYDADEKIEDKADDKSDDKTVAVIGVARIVDSNKNKQDAKTKVSYGSVRASARTGAATAMTSPEATFLQADNLRIAQSRILDLEKELERVRSENEELAAAGETMRIRADDLQIRLNHSEVERRESMDSLESEIQILKSAVSIKENENRHLKAKIEELEGRLSSDLKKIRLRERELENRLELLRMEKTTLVQSKDEALLDLKRKMDQLKTECDNYRNKCQELNKTIESNQDQVRRTVRALRLALTNLEVGDDTGFPLKKAE